MSNIVCDPNFPYRSAHSTCYKIVDGLCCCQDVGVPCSDLIPLIRSYGAQSYELQGSGGREITCNGAIWDLRQAVDSGSNTMSEAGVLQVGYVWEDCFQFPSVLVEIQLQATLSCDEETGQWKIAVICDHAMSGSGSGINCDGGTGTAYGKITGEYTIPLLLDYALWDCPEECHADDAQVTITFNP